MNVEGVKRVLPSSQVMRRAEQPDGEIMTPPGTDGRAHLTGQGHRAQPAAESVIMSSGPP